MKYNTKYKLTIEELRERYKKILSSTHLPNDIRVKYNKHLNDPDSLQQELDVLNERTRGNEVV